MPDDRSRSTLSQPRWRRHDLERAAADIARSLGWAVFAIGTTVAPWRVGPGRMTAGGPHLLLVHPGQRRLVLAWLTVRRPADVRIAGPYHDLDRRYTQLDPHVAEKSAQIVPDVAVCVWGPDDLENGDVAEVLRGRWLAARRPAA